MGKLNNEAGFGAMETVLVLVIFILIGVVGYMVYKDHHKTSVANTPASPSINKASKSANAAKTYSPKDAVTFTQNTYNAFLAAINNVGPNNTQPLGLVGLAAVKNNLTTAMYSKAASSHNASDFSCAAQFVPNKYTASLDFSDNTNATVSLTIDNGGGVTTQGMTVNVNLTSLKITAVSCPN